MKKIVSLATLCIIMCIFFWTCKKDQSTSNKNLTTEEQELIANAKTYFENNVQNTIQGKRLSDVTDTTPGQFNPIRSLLKSADWSNAYTIKLSIGKIVVAPINFSDSLYARPESTDSTTRLSINNLVKLIVYKDSAKQLHVEVVTAFPDSNFLNNPTGTFSGIAYVQDWQGNFLRAYKYSDGTVAQLSLSENVNDNVSTNSVRSPDLVAIVTCFSMSYTSCAGTDDDPYQECTYFTQNLGCITTSTGNGGGDGAPTSGDYGNVAHAGGSSSSGISNSSVGIFYISNDSVTDACLRDVVEHLMTSGAKNIITNTINNIFGESTKLNLTFKDAAILPPDAGGDLYAYTAPPNIDPLTGALNVSITLNQSLLAGASKEFVAQVLVHEIIHAYLDVNPNLFNAKINQHIEMGENYVTQMAIALQNFYPGLSITAANSLTLYGLSAFYINNTPPGYWDQLVAQYGFNTESSSTNNYSNLAQQYLTGDTGTPCKNIPQ